MAGLDYVGSSRAPDLTSMDSADRVEAMVKWFLANFEDPAENTPHENGYVYIWGGPFDADDELQNAFPEATDAELQEAVEMVQEDGIINWAPHTSRIQEVEELPEPEAPPDVGLTVEPIRDRIRGLEAELNGIEEGLRRLRELRDNLGHNQPPEEFQLGLSEVELDEALQSVGEVRAEALKPDPIADGDVEPLKRAQSRFENIARKIGAAIATGAGALIVGVLSGLGKHIGEHPGQFLALLNHVVDVVSAWISEIGWPW